MRLEMRQLLLKINSVAFLSCHILLQLPLNITLTSKYHGIIYNIVSDWQKKNHILKKRKWQLETKIQL